MSSYVPAKYGVEYIFYVGLSSVATAGAFQANPTLASGDVKISKNGGTLANLTTLPAVTPSSSKMVKVTISATEMQADNVTLIFSDASGAEWHDLIVNIHTAARQIDDLAFPTVSGRSIDVTTTGAAGIDWGNVENATATVALTGTTAGLIDNAVTAAKLATDAGVEIADAILSRSRANVDSTASPDSLYELIAAILDGDTSSGALVTKQTDGTTTFSTRTLSTNPSAVPIVGVSGQ